MSAHSPLCLAPGQPLRHRESCLVGEFVCCHPRVVGWIVVLCPGGYRMVGPAEEWEKVGPEEGKAADGQ